MSNERYIYCQIILKLIKHRYSYIQAKQMLYESNIMERIKYDILYILMTYFFHYYPKDWIEWIEKEYGKKYKKRSYFYLFVHKLLKIFKIRI